MKRVVICASNPLAASVVQRAVSREGLAWAIHEVELYDRLPWSEISSSLMVYLQGPAADVVHGMHEWQKRTIQTPLVVEMLGATPEHVLAALRAGARDVLLEPPTANMMVGVFRRTGLLARERVSMADLLDQTDAGQLTTFRQLGVSIRQIEEHLHDPSHGVAEAIDVLANDPALVRGVLEAANSPAWGSRRVGTLREACVRLGLAQLAMLARQVLLSDVYAIDDPLLTDLASAMWGNAVATSSGARALARELRLDPVALGNAALLHNIGEVAILGLVARSDVRERGQPSFRNMLIDTYVEYHEPVGANVLEGMGCSPFEVAMARHHHMPVRLEAVGIDPRCGLVNNLAWELAIQLGFSYPRRDRVVVLEEVCAQLGIQLEWAKRIVRKALFG